ncbi:MAG: SufD family Fe-S cluster assembly protein [Candidatus Diapherotrites archaeon]|nr:SufD family Fe-S cluster assembly protein [Candidatus Diapherotrites archaeon]
MSQWTRKEKLKLGKEVKEYTAYFLYFGEQILQNPLYFVNVSKIEAKGKQTTYDIEVEGNHNFIANGIFVNNSRLTMKYPSIYLRGEGSKAEILSVALAGKGQHQDTGAKAIHLASNTTSTITSKSISKDGGRASYRGLLKVARGCKNVKSNVVCDALILDKDSRSDTYPTIEVDEPTAATTHEARVGKVGQDQIFYLMSRGLSEQEALTLIVMGFISPFTKELPMEYAIELNRLIEMEMEGCVG